MAIELESMKQNPVMINVPVPVASLVADPAAAKHGPFAALAQGADWCGKLERLDAAVLAQEQVDMPVKHHFSHGVYARELFIPKGTVLTGRIHKRSQINILAKGEISVLTEHGIERLKAPATIVSPPGTKRAGYAHEDTIWITVCGVDGKEQAPDALEQELTTRTFAEYAAYCAGLIESKEH